MGSEFTFYDYMDDVGNNVIHNWLNGIPVKAKAKFNKWLLHLEGTPPGLWRRPMVDSLDAACDGLFEVRVPLDRQYRILGYRDGRTPTLVHCFTKPDAKVDPGECQRAYQNQAKIAHDSTRRVEHNYG